MKTSVRPWKWPLRRNCWIGCCLIGCWWMGGWLIGLAAGWWAGPVSWPRTAAAQTTDQEHHHHHDSAAAPAVKPPKVFLDKSPRIVQYQLGRLDNERLLLVERKTDDPKYAPVYLAILTRAGMSPQYREEALRALVELNGSDPVRELLKSLESIRDEDRQQRRTGRELAEMLVRQPAERLAAGREQLLEATGAERPLIRAVGYAGLIAAGDGERARSQAMRGASSQLDWLAAISLVPAAAERGAQREAIVPLLDAAQPVAVRRAAIQALAHVPTAHEDTFRRVASLASDQRFQTAAIRTLLRIPAEARDADTSRELVDLLVHHAESTPAAQRTTDEFLDAMQLVDQLLARLPVDAARDYRRRLREVVVRVVVIRTIVEEMRYDTPYFAVEAGRPVQVVLRNEDLMPHNLVVTLPGALQEVAEQGAALGPQPGFENKLYVPRSEKVLFATQMVPSAAQEALTFTAPSEPGEYPFVCTFPRHWMRMHGVMVVVDDLDKWLQDPVEPKSPIGSNRSFVQAWKPEDLLPELEAGLQGRSREIGERIFQEATCAGCHKMNGMGGAVGPELTDVFPRWKGDRGAVLREILEPSHRIDPKYAVHLVVTTEGKTVSGIVLAQDQEAVTLLDNPESKQPIVIKRANIEEMVKTSTSMMPKALLDRFTKDEVFELLAYLEAGGKPASR